jgi:hypothetical protein
LYYLALFYHPLFACLLAPEAFGSFFVPAVL